MEKICVAVRVRPPARDESIQANKWKVSDNTVSLCNSSGNPISGQSFAFDYVFGTEVKNRSIYEAYARGVIMAALNGFNGTIFAYGQTSSGKTYTMQGSADDPGLIGLTIDEVFGNLQKMVDREYLIRVSYMEIYNEEINDLLAPENRKLQIHENLERGIFVAGLREQIVNNQRQVCELLKFGEARRHIGQTNMNVYSSRSHTIFRMVIESNDKGQNIEAGISSDAVRVSVLNLVDLAGSERVAKTGAGGTRLRDGTHINKSLMTLGTVIKKLSDNTAKQGGHIPYRDSKLTRILQPALGGNAKTAIICTVAPEEIHTDETRGTLQFASRAKTVTTCAQVNEIITDAALLKRQKKEIEDLRNKLHGFRSEVLEQEILRLRNDLLKFELEKERLALELQEERESQKQKEQRIKEQEQKIENLSSLFISSALDEHDHDKLEKQGSDRESGHTRRLSLESPSQEFRRYKGKRPSEESFSNIRVTLRRENFPTPPSFNALLDTSEGNVSKHVRRKDGFTVPQDFENIADEDMWNCLNNGRVPNELKFLDMTPGNCMSSAESSKARKASVIHCALMNSNAEKEKITLHLDEVIKEKAELQKQLVEQFAFQDQLEKALLELEREIDCSQLVADSLQENWKDVRMAQVSNSASLQLLRMHMKEVEGDVLQQFELKIKTLEQELSTCKQENLELKARNQVLQEQVNLCNPSRSNKTSMGESTRPRSKRKNDSRKETGHSVPTFLLSSQVEDDVYPQTSNNDNQQREYRNDRDERIEDTVNAVNKEDDRCFKERLQMSQEQIRELERQCVLAKLENERACKALTDKSHAVDNNLEKLMLARKVGRFIEALAKEEDFIDSICLDIRRFESQLKKQKTSTSQTETTPVLACSPVC